MLNVGPDPETWSPDLHTVVSAIAGALNGREPDAVLVMALRPDYEHCVPDHRVELGWIPRGEGVDPPNSNFPPEYWISLTGRRIEAIWTILASDLHAELKRKNSNFGAT
jgi:hypothetical protein